MRYSGKTVEPWRVLSIKVNRHVRINCQAAKGNFTLKVICFRNFCFKTSYSIKLFNVMLDPWLITISMRLLTYKPKFDFIKTLKKLVKKCNHESTYKISYHSTQIEQVVVNKHIFKCVRFGLKSLFGYSVERPHLTLLLWSQIAWPAFQQNQVLMCLNSYWNNLRAEYGHLEVAVFSSWILGTRMLQDRLILSNIRLSYPL